MFTDKIDVPITRAVTASLFDAAAESRGAIFSAPLRASLLLAVGAGLPSYGRAAAGHVADHEGVLRACLGNEARFVGARRVRNLLSG